MRIDKSVTSLSWIPSEAVSGPLRLAFDAGVAHYDQPPPEVLGDTEQLRKADRFRFLNRLAAFVETDGNGRIADAGYDAGGAIGSTTMRLGPLHSCFQAFSLPDLRGEPEWGDDCGG